jgi:hypothetical protein
MFGLLFSFIPGQFWGTAGPQGTIQGANFPTSFKVQDILQFNSTINNTQADFPYEEIYDIGLPSGQMLSVQWSTLGASLDAPDGKLLRLKHLTDNFLGYWWGQHDLDVYSSNGTLLDKKLFSTAGQAGTYYSGVDRSDIIAAWDSSKNMSEFVFICPEGTINTLVSIKPSLPNMTIAQSWDAGVIYYTFGYAIDWSKVGYNAFTILGKLLSFQAPDLGIGGVGGTILGQMVAFMIWPMIAYIVYKIVMGVIPWVSGGSGD